MEYIRGRVLEGMTLPGMTPSQGRAIYFDMIRLLADLHSVYYLPFSLFRLASILQRVYKGGIMGAASSSEALEKGRMARESPILPGPFWDGEYLIKTKM